MVVEGSKVKVTGGETVKIVFRANLPSKVHPFTLNQDRMVTGDGVL